MRLLAIDTATENCSAALFIDSSVQSREIEMERGHAERILPMIDDLLAEAGITLQDLVQLYGGLARLGSTISRKAPPTENSNGSTSPVRDEMKPTIWCPSSASGVAGVPCLAR